MEFIQGFVNAINPKDSEGKENTSSPTPEPTPSPTPEPERRRVPTPIPARRRVPTPIPERRRVPVPPYPERIINPSARQVQEPTSSDQSSSREQSSSPFSERTIPKSYQISSLPKLEHSSERMSDPTATLSPVTPDASERIPKSDDPFDIETINDICDGTLTKDNYLERISLYLKQIGFNIDITNLYSVLTSKHPIDWSEILPIITKEDRTYKMNLKGKEIILKNYREISRGTFNAAYTCDTNSPNFKEIVLRTTIGITTNKLHQTIYENLKHIILYLVNRCNIGKEYQLIPQPLYFGLYKKSETQNQIFFLMEKGDYTLDKKLTDKFIKMVRDTFNDDDKLEIRKLIYSFYKSLILFNENLDYFAHSDAKFNNALIKNNKIMLIDFGFSTFKLFDLDFKSEYPGSIYYSLASKHYNAVQDLCQLLFSLIYVIKSFLLDNGINTKTNKIKILSNIHNTLDIKDKNFIGYKIFKGHVLKRMSDTPADSIWRLFYKNNYQKYFSDYNIYIDPDEMKTDYKIDVSDNTLYNNFYYKKYLLIRKTY